jgi:hypothetical protein
VCAPHRVKGLNDLATLEIPDSPVVDHSPVIQNAVGNVTLKIGEVVSPTDSDLQSRNGVERVASVHSTQAVTETNGIVGPLGSDHNPDPLVPPVADILINGVVRRISHIVAMLFCVLDKVKN